MHPAFSPQYNGGCTSWLACRTVMEMFLCMRQSHYTSSLPITHTLDGAPSCNLVVVTVGLGHESNIWCGCCVKPWIWSFYTYLRALPNSTMVGNPLVLLANTRSTNLSNCMPLRFHIDSDLRLVITLSISLQNAKKLVVRKVSRTNKRSSTSWHNSH